jgi:hypothetical protein
MCSCSMTRSARISISQRRNRAPLAAPSKGAIALRLFSRKVTIAHARPDCYVGAHAVLGAYGLLTMQGMSTTKYSTSTPTQCYGIIGHDVVGIGQPRDDAVMFVVGSLDSVRGSWGNEWVVSSETESCAR